MPINASAVMEEVNRLLAEARTDRATTDFGAVNWGDIAAADVEYRFSTIRRGSPYYVVIVEEADPHAFLAQWLNERLDKEKFPNTHIECEW
jgi:hypothetical protein